MKKRSQHSYSFVIYSRVFDIACILSDKPCASDEIATQCNISERSFFRYLKAARDLGIPINLEQHQYSITDDFWVSFFQRFSSNKTLGVAFLKEKSAISNWYVFITDVIDKYSTITYSNNTSY